MNKELPKIYEPQEVESRIYAAGEKNGCFRGVRDPEKKPFTIVMPPPTGQIGRAWGRGSGSAGV